MMLLLALQLLLQIFAELLEEVWKILLDLAILTLVSSRASKTCCSSDLSLCVSCAGTLRCAPLVGFVTDEAFDNALGTVVPVDGCGIAATAEGAPPGVAV
jgi:hypothetical protein